jgi:F0F1-type ATP synthase alpha subunit
VDEGIKAGSLTVNIPSFRKIASQYAQDPKTINALAELAQVEAMWQFQQRQGLGSGTSVSNFEQQMVNQMGPNIKDPYDAYLKKLAFMRAKADFDRSVAQELKGGKQYEDFEGTEKFNQLFEQYKKKIMPIVYGTGTKPRADGTSKVNPASRDALYKALQ